MSELSENAINQMINSLDIKELIVLKFTAEWCGPCKSLSPILEEIASELGEKINRVFLTVLYDIG